jgi:alcohol dehydrogenase class IV
VRAHVSSDAAERARAVARQNRVDLLLSVGGGSAIGLAKAVALHSGLPIVAVPTTYSGSEATAVWGLTDDGIKTTGIDPRVLPGTIIYDAELTQSMPRQLSVSSGLNALAHAIDALWAPRCSPATQSQALKAIRMLAAALPAVAENPGSLAARDQALRGAYLAAAVFNSTGSGLHHKICHVLGGTFGLPHSDTHAVMLPHVLAINLPAVPGLHARLADALEQMPTAGDAPGASKTDAVAALARLYDRLDAPRSLAALGFAEADIETATGIILPLVPASNPGEISREILIELLRAAL